MPTEDFSPNAVAMTSKDLLLEVYRDMRVVRPAVEALLQANVVSRVETLERDALRLQAVGINDNLVNRVNTLEKRDNDEDAAGGERKRIGQLTNKTLAIIILVGQFALGAIIFFANLATKPVPQ